MLMCLETADDPSITRLHIRGEVRLKEFQLNIGRIVGYRMARKVVGSQHDEAILAPHLFVQEFDPSVARNGKPTIHFNSCVNHSLEKFRCHPSFLVVPIIEAVGLRPFLLEATWLF